MCKKEEEERLSAPDSTNLAKVAISNSSDKFVEELYKKTIGKQQDLNTTGKELSIIGKDKSRTSSIAQKRKRMTET